MHECDVHSGSVIETGTYALPSTSKVLGASGCSSSRHCCLSTFACLVCQAWAKLSWLCVWVLQGLLLLVSHWVVGSGCFALHVIPAVCLVGLMLLPRGSPCLLVADDV